ncbi:MAG: hypothetical protein ACI4RP_09235 [Acutalibacteraceae bacterium]
MKKKKKKHHILMRSIKMLSFLLAVVSLTVFLQEFLLCHCDHNRERIKGFYLEDRDSLDVVFIGASEVYSGFSSAYAYKRFGFTSYPFATQCNIISNYKSQIKEVIKRQHPKLIVVELNGALYSDNEELDDEVNFRNYVDNIPLDRDKVQIVKDYAPENELEYYLPIVKYHTVWYDWPSDDLNWSLATIQDAIRGHNLLKGAKNRTEVFIPDEEIYNSYLQYDEQRNELTEKSEYYLRDMLKFCKSENITNIVFTRFPHIVVEKHLGRFHRGNTAGDIVEEYGYDFLNFEKDFEDTGLDTSNDFYDIDHLNIYGQQKFTEYLGSILCEDYGVTKRELTDSQKAEWDESTRYYDAFYKFGDAIIKDGEIFEDIGESYLDMQQLKNYL